jgi:chloride channel 7
MSADPAGGYIIYELREGQDNYALYELVPVLLLGVIGGLLGSSFIALHTKLYELRRQLYAIYGNQAKVVEVVCISLLTSTVSFLLPLTFGCQVRWAACCSLWASGG